MSDNEFLRPKIGVGVLVWRDKQLLLGNRKSENQPDCWQFPGGHLENTESIIDCARREVMEEAGIVVKALRHLGFTDKPFKINQHAYITLLVSCVHESGEVQTLEPDKCGHWQWFDYQNLPSPLFKPITVFMSQLTALQQSDLYALHCASQVVPDIPSIAHK